MDAQLIFQNPNEYKDDILRNVEGQYFDRKEVRNDNNGLKDARKNIKECISAFTNSRGGILILGIEDTGIIKGLNHLSETEYNSLTQILADLTNHQTQTKEFYIDGKKLLAFYCPEGLSGVCKTNDRDAKAWVREAANNLRLTADREEVLLLERNKKWEQLIVCDYDEKLINQSVFDIFKKRYLEEQDANFEYSDEDFALNTGITKVEKGTEGFTNAGFLFTANNPSAYIPSAQVRFLKFDVESKDYEKRGNPVFDKTFSGNLPDLLRKIRSLVNEGALFKKYTYRSTIGSGIIEEPELPPNAVEEAIVNALIHRDYNTPLPVECLVYKDAFVVKSPGSLKQPRHIETKFNLEEQKLISYPRNPKIAQWAKTMKDDKGQRFVKLLSEGHRTMLSEMKAMNLPAPLYYTNGFTTVFLYNNYAEREERIKKLQQPLGDEFINLFKIDFKYNTVSEPEHSNKTLQTQLIHLIKDKFLANDWVIDRLKAGRLTVHQKGKHEAVNQMVDKIVRFYPAYMLQVHTFEGGFYLSIDYDVQVKNVLRLNASSLAKMNCEGNHAQVAFQGIWTTGKIETYNNFTAKVLLYDYETVEEVPLKDVIPSLSKTTLSQLMPRGFNLDKHVKNISLASMPNASKERSKKILDVAKYVEKVIFPIAYNGFTAFIKSRPIELILPKLGENNVFSLHKNLKEPQVKFNQGFTNENVLTGLTKYGAAKPLQKTIEIVPICITGFEKHFDNLIQTLQRGQMNFRGMERTFGVRLTYRAVITKLTAEEFLGECKRLINENPQWKGDLNRIFLIHIPEDKYPPTDIKSPYFTLKDYLLSNGIPCQMLDTPILLNSKFKDLNLALNINAKVGGTPWVLPDALSEADCFIGLSYAQYWDENKLNRTMGYANVFDNYGQWQYYKGNGFTFDYYEKHIHLAALVKNVLAQKNHLSDTASIHIHYSNKFSIQDRKHIYEAVKSVLPNATVSFIWINTYHNIRIFDNRIEGDGSLSRGNYVVTRPNQLYLSTTGYTPMKKMLGTPIMLEINALTEPYQAHQIMPYRTIAQHILALTKLNWSSTQSINGMPVTIKYAHNIARLSATLYRNNPNFKLHQALEDTPWFL